MEHFTGSDIQVVLSLKEGRGFHRLSNPTSIVATLNGQCLETGSIEPDSNPYYATDLVWKTDKNTLRKMRSGQEPLKIECFEMKENETREKIGHVLLSLRTARIIPPRDEEVRLTPNWHKFYNLRNDVKTDKPEILIALTIEEHEAYERRISRQESTERESRRWQSDISPRSQDGIPRPYLVAEERLIQLGPIETCRCLFFLNIIAGTAQNLHLLKEEAGEDLGDYSLWYRVMENDVLLKSFGSLDKRLSLNEKAMIRIRSSLKILKNYLRARPNFLLIIQQGERILGHSEIDLRPLIPAEVTEDSVRKGGKIDGIINHRCILSKQRTPRNIGDCEDNEAFLDLQLQLVYEGSKNPEETRSFDEKDVREIPPKSQLRYGRSNIRHEIIEDIDSHRNPCGDYRKFIGPDHATTGLKNIQIDRDLPSNGKIPRSIVTGADSTGNDGRSVEAFHCYCLHVRLTAMKLSSAIQNIEFRFHHPKAEIMSTMYPKMPCPANEKLRLQEIGCELNFISAANEIRNLLSSFPPRVSVRDVADETKAYAGQTILDVDLLFVRDKHENQYEASLYDSDKKAIGTIDVFMYLEDRGPYYKTQRRSSAENLGPPIMDDDLAYRIVEELEIWKERQEEIFMTELKKKEERHLNRLSEEWQIRRENLESKLACSVEQCKMLANSLNMATEDLRTRRLKSLEKEARLIKANEDLQWRYDNDLQELREASRRMQDDFASKINHLEEQNSRAGSELESLRLENEKLARLSSKQAEELQICRKGSLTQDQTASLLQEVKALEQKLATAQTSKTFFKEQWGKAVREIHRMKMEHQQAIEVQIKTSKDELKNLDLEDILCADSSSLTNDQIILGQIQKEIDVIKPRSILIHADESSHRSFYPPLETVFSQRGAKPNSAEKSEEQDERLRKLIEERDSLLKTGSYTIDDAIIMKLNAEIRSLLISN